jgi:hypothetical protein
MKIISDDEGGEYEAVYGADPARNPGGCLDEATLGPLIDRLERYLKKGGAKTVDRDRLKMIVAEEVLGYHLARTAKTPPNNLHQLAKPLQRVIEILLEDGSFIGVFDALTPPPVNLERVDEQDLVAPWHKYVDLLNCLLAINRALPGKNPAHRPAKTGDLCVLVAELVGYWERATPADFKGGWAKKGEALKGENLATTAACAFVWEVVAYVDRDALPSLPKAVEATVSRLRNSRNRRLLNSRK